MKHGAWKILRVGAASAAILALTALAPGYAAESTAISLKDALKAGVYSNPQYGSAEQNKKATEEELRQGKAGYLPSVDLRADAGYEHSEDIGTRAREGDGDITLSRHDMGLTLTQMLFDGWATPSEVKRQKARVQSAGLRLDGTAELVGLSIVESYLDVLRQRQLLMIAQKNVREHQSILKLVQDGVEAGRTTQADAEQVKGRLAAAKTNESSTLQSLKNAESEYKRAVGEMPGELGMPALPLEALEQDVEQEVLTAHEKSPNLKAASSDIDTAKAELEGTKAAFYPNVDLQMNARTGSDLGGVEGHDESAAALVVMNWNLYRGGADAARSRQFSHRHEQSKQAFEEARRSLENDVRQTWAAMIASGERAKEFQSQVAANEKVVSAYKDQFSLDRRTLLDVLDSQNELFVTRSSTVNAEFLEMFAVYRLLALKGSLLPAIGVEYPAAEATMPAQVPPTQEPQKGG